MKVSLSKVKQSPVTFLYIFATKDFCRSLGKVGNVIWSKGRNQLQMLNNIAVDNGSNLQSYSEIVKQAIIDQYGMTPAEILVKLAQGESVAGKNWKEGVFGVGALRQTSYTTDATVSVNPKTGKLINSSDGLELADQTPIYKVGNNGKAYIAGYSASKGGTTYTTEKHLNSYYANTIATADTQLFANGQPFDATMSDSIWTSLFTYAPMIKQIIEWILSLFSAGRVAITPQNTVPSQQEFTYQSGLSSGELLLLLGGAAAIYSFSK